MMRPGDELVARITSEKWEYEEWRLDGAPSISIYPTLKNKLNRPSLERVKSRKVRREKNDN